MRCDGSRRCIWMAKYSPAGPPPTQTMRIAPTALWSISYISTNFPPASPETSSMRDHPNPMHGPNKLKLGVFSANADGGLTLTRVPERWRAEWPDVVAVAQMADRAGLEFFLPIARWRGFGGVTNSREWSFETLTEAAALAGLTEQIALFATVHVPMVHPVFAAKALTTIDHAS